MSARDPQACETWSIKNILEGAEGFHTTLADEFSIDMSWVQFGDVMYTAGYQGSMGPPGSGFSPPRKNDSNPTPGNCRRNPQEPKNLPLRDNQMQMPNPKGVVAAVEGNMTAVRGAYNEAAEVASMPVLIVVQAVESMAQVKDIGAEVEKRNREQKTKEIVAWVLTGVFQLVPFVGEAAGSMGWATATMARMAALIGMVKVSL